MTRLLLIALVGCAARRPPQAELAPARDQRAEIDRLAADIEQKRGELQLLEPTQDQLDHAPGDPRANPIKDPSCRPAQTETCKSSCTLGDSICDNAHRICELARSLPGDMYATQKCARANTVCDAASEKCCKCR